MTKHCSTGRMAAISQLPADTQDDIARLMLAEIDHADGPPAPPQSGRIEAAAIAEAEAEIARGDRVPAETIQAFWRSRTVYECRLRAPRSLRDLDGIAALSDCERNPARRRAAALALTFNETMQSGFALGATDPEAGAEQGNAAGTSLVMHATVQIDDLDRFLNVP